MICRISKLVYCSCRGFPEKYYQAVKAPQCIRAAQAAKQATKTIPIVATSGDPVGAGLVDSLARPGGNVTGLANLSYDLAAKRLELLKEVVPKASRIAIIWSKDTPNAARWINEMEAAAAVMKIDLKTIEIKGPKDFDP